MEPLKAEDLRELSRRISQYRLFFWIYVASAAFYAASAAALTAQTRPSPYPLADGSLAFGLFALLVVFLGRWAAFRPSALRRLQLDSMQKMVRYIFFTWLFLLAMGESLGMTAVTAAALGAGPPWKMLLLCLWQVLAGLVLTPERAHWDRVLSLWQQTFPPPTDRRIP
ncbi:MAG: hypothetical protein WBS54_05270 [Acidobacteriota bacterium]